MSKKTVSEYKKLNKDFVGVCELRQLPKGMFFKTIDKNGKLSKETYIKDYYVRESKGFCSIKCSDIYGNGRLVKGVAKVTTNFEF